VKASRDAVFEIALAFVGAALLRFRGFLREAVDMILGSYDLAVSELTLAPPKAPQIARRALAASPSEQVRRLTHIAMRPLPRKSSRLSILQANFQLSTLIAGGSSRRSRKRP
jgi:hypothetical protein